VNLKDDPIRAISLKFGDRREGLEFGNGSHNSRVIDENMSERGLCEYNSISFQSEGGLIT
jgi:hypothetical protein